MPPACSDGRMTELRVGLIGAGMVARHHAIGWSRCKDARLVAIADPNAEAAARLAEGDMTVHDTLAALLRDAKVDAIDIATPVATHVPLVQEAVAAGLPVLCQKPLAPSSDAAAGLSDLPQYARIMLHENWRWRPTYRALKAHLGDRPQPHSFEFRCESSGLCRAAEGTFPALERQPFLADLDRLIVFELLGHHIDVLTFLFGPVDILAARTQRRCPAVRGEDAARIDLVAGGVRGTLCGDFAVPDAPPRPRDTLTLDARDVVTDWSLDLDGAIRTWSAEDGYQESYDACIAHFASCTLTSRPYETPVEHGVSLLQAIEAVYRLCKNLY